MCSVLYRLLADVVVVLHLAVIVFVAVGGLLAWRRPSLLAAHVVAVVWAVAIVTIGFTCPLTPLEKELRQRADGDTYDGGFIDHYLTDVVYPGEYLGFARAVVAMLVVAGWAGLLARRLRQV